MVFGLPIDEFTRLHVLISLIGIASGFAVLAGMLLGKHCRNTTAVFLAMTVLTSVTGFMFPLGKVGPPHIIGALSMVVLAAALWALYGKRLVGRWRVVYIISAVIALYLNVFVGVVQAFQKVEAINALAPTQTEPPFAIAQGATLLLFAGLGFLALKRR